MRKRIFLLGLVLLSGIVAATQMVEAVPPSFQNEIVIGSGLTFPTALEFLPDGRMLIAEFRGKVWIVQAGAAQIDTTPVIQLSNIIDEDVTVGGERGLVNIIADPNFATNGFIYMFYTANSPQRDRVSRFTMAGNTASLASELVIWQGVADSTRTDHHGGSMAFGPDGKLYICTGDNADPPSVQLLTSDHGKILRVNSDGTVPTDNPFFDGTGSNIDAIWARGLRNPYRMSLDAPTGKLYIGDVGENTFEEVNIAARGANYGWPTCEGNCSTSGMTNPIFTYNHNGRDSAITGGIIYRGNQFPSSYQGVYFYGDYAQNWIRYLTFNASGAVTGSQNFEPTDGTLDGPYGDPVMFKLGPDGSLYYVDFGWPGPENPAAIRRIRYTAANQPPTVNVSASPLSGLSPLTVNFSSAGSSDPEGQTLSYIWTFGDGGTSTQANPSHVYSQNGLYTARLTLSDGVNSTLSNVITISVGNVPAGVVTSPLNNSTFRAGDVINFAGTATDPDDGTLPASAYSWTILFRHDDHVHPVLGPLTGVTSGSFTIPTSGHDFSDNTAYEIILTVTDSNGLQNRSSVLILPQKVNLSFNSSPPGLTLTIDGISRATPFVKDTLIGFQHNIGAPGQSFGGTNYSFVSWSDAGTQTHGITVPATAQSYVATYQATGSSIPPGQIAAYNFDEGSGATATDVTGNNHTGTLTNGPVWTAGKFGSGLSFDGVNDMVSVADSNMLDLSTGMTLSAWVFPTATSGVRDIIIKEGSNVDIYNLYARNGQGNPESNVFVGGTNRTAVGPVLTTNTWTHVAGTYDGATLKLFLNGVQAATLSVSGAMPASTGALRIGGNSLWGENFLGIIDDVRVYNRALTATEIQADMNAPVGGGSPPPPDTTPPVISAVGSSGITSSGANISWTTNEASDTQVEYGTTLSYGSSSPLNTSMVTSHSVSLSGLAPGTPYNYRVKSRDAAGNLATSGNFTFTTAAAGDTTLPNVSITAPTGGTVSGTVTVTATATDNVGVVGVQFLLDGANLGTEDTTSPYSVSWNTTTASQGSHTLQARARDAAGNQRTSTSVIVTVANAIPNLVAAYAFDEGTGSTASDASGNLNTGTISNPVWVTGRYGNALQFNGFTDWVTVADANTLDLTNAITIEAWVFPTSDPTGWRSIVAKEQTDGLAYYLYASSRGTNVPATGVFVSGAERTLTGGTRLAINTWAHIAATYNGTIQRLYVNGVQVSTRNQTGTAAVSTGVLRIGGNNPFGEFFKGLIDEVRIYNKVLTQAQIQTDMNTPITPGATGLLREQGFNLSDFVASTVLHEEVITPRRRYMNQSRVRK
jgi:glucose/arabinose dehydrogenase